MNEVVPTKPICLTWMSDEFEPMGHASSCVHDDSVKLLIHLNPSRPELSREVARYSIGSSTTKKVR
jgi:hypothetical protein